MKIIVASLVAAIGFLSVAPAMAAPVERRHKVCRMDHHHRVCHWVR